MLKIVVPTLLLLAALTAHAQSTHSHTIHRSDGSSVTYRTTCSGSRSYRHCSTTETEKGPRVSKTYTGSPLPDKKFCKAMRKSYGDNLERFTHPIGYNLSFCIADEALQLRIRAANAEEIKNGREGKTMNPLYKPK